MIENVNASKMPGTGEFLDIKKYIGVASINILAINPDNAKLRKYGWTVPDDADEPKYVSVNSDGKKITKVRFLVQIMDLDEAPVLALDFWVRPEMMISKSDKCKIIDAYGRTAWGTKDEIMGHLIPTYADGKKANISLPYKPCHPGEEEIVLFLFKYLNITPLQIFNRLKNEYVDTKNPGRLTIDDWGKICDGNITELAKYVALQPDNRVKVILGVRSTDDNKTYQTFLNTSYISNASLPDKVTGEYLSARKAIDKFFDGRTDSPYSFSATPVREWTETATEVKDNSSSLFNTDNTVVVDEDSDDLPF